MVMKIAFIGGGAIGATMISVERFYLALPDFHIRGLA